MENTVVLNELKEKVEQNQRDLQRILLLLEEINSKTKRMDQHINVIEHTYEGLRKPIDFVKQKIDYITDLKPSKYRLLD